MYIRLSIEHKVARIILDRPEVHHAMHIGMIRELHGAFEKLVGDRQIRIIVLQSTGKHFCAGADLQWMKDGLLQDETQLKAESRELAALYRLMSELPQLCLCTVQGSVMGGGLGLMAASDVVLAEESARFAFSEVRLGLIPATIAPHVLRKAGRGWTIGRMISGQEFGIKEAREGGLVHFSCETGMLEPAREELIRALLSNGPEAVRGVKALLSLLEQSDRPDEEDELMASLIARHRVSDEGQEGIRAFLEKRKSSWNTDG